MRILVYGVLLLIGLTSAAEPVTEQKQNSTKDESTINKRYIVTIPQYNPFFYANSQVLPTQSLVLANEPYFGNYINSFLPSYDSIPRYYILPQNQFLQSYGGQKIVPQIQNNVVPSSPQAQILPQQIVQTPQVVPQQIVPQRVVPQQIVPQQQIIPQKIITQPAILQQVIPQRITVPQVVPQQVVPQQVVPQQVVPQQVVPQQVVPQRLIQQQIVPQQVPQVIPHRIVPQQIVPQQIVPQQIPPQKQLLPQKIQLPIPPYRPQHIVPPIQQNSLPPLLHQPPTVPYHNTKSFYAPLHTHYYHPQPPKQQILLRNQPYPYEVPPGQNKLPATILKQHPVYGVPPRVPQVYPVARTQNLIYNVPPQSSPLAYLQQNQPQTVYVNPTLQASNPGPQQVVRIGYAPPHLNQGEFVQNTAPHTVYLNPNLYTSYEGGQQVVRIGYVHPPLNQDVVQEVNDAGSQKLKLGLPYVEQNGVTDYQYGNGRAARTVVEKEGVELKETETKT